MLAAGVASLIAYPAFLQFIPMFKPDTAVLQRRAQSMSTLQRPEKLEMYEDDGDDDFLAFEKECGELEAHRQGLVAAQSQSNTTIDTRYEALNIHSKKQRPFKPRRVQSGPARIMDSATKRIIEDMDDWDDDFTLGEYVVPQVQKKSEVLNTKQIVTENWDGDFNEDEVLDIPDYMNCAQIKFQNDKSKVQRFALHILGNH